LLPVGQTFQSVLTGKNACPTKSERRLRTLAALVCAQTAFNFGVGGGTQVFTVEDSLVAPNYNSGWRTPIA
jgi:hypothetical protein